MRTFAVAACLAAAVATDDMCDDAQTILRKLVEAKCNATNVVCVYKKDGDCDDWCSPSPQCGYISQSGLYDVSCNVTATSSTSVTGSVTCTANDLGLGKLAEALGVTILVVYLLAVAAVVLFACCCCCVVWCFCCR
jgi:hypothetical protein